MTLRDAKLTALILLVILAGLISSFFQPSPAPATVILANHTTTRAVALWTGQEFVPYLETTVQY